MLPLERQSLLKEVNKALPDWAPLSRSIMVGLRGSDAHGTKLEDKGPNDIDDVDVFSIIVRPRNYYLSFHGYNKKHEHWDSAGNTLDILVYDIRKFMYLAASSNPNVINWLYNRPEDYLFMTPLGQRLIDNRSLFLSKEIFPKLSGYAYSQMKRMHGDQKYQGYMGAKRKGLVDTFGYDLKNAAHCVRLIGMAIEIATENTMSTYRPDENRQLIKEIKRGNYSLLGITAIIENLMRELDSKLDKCTLPDHTNKSLISDIMVDIIEDF